MTNPPYGTHAQEIPVVAKIMALRGKGYSLGMIADHLNQLGYTTRTGRRWTKKQVSRVETYVRERKK